LRNTGAAECLRCLLAFVGMTVEPSEPRAELAALTRRTGSRLRTQNLLHPLAGAAFDESCAFTRRRRRVTWATNGSLFLIEAQAASGIVFAVGRPDPILGARHPAGVVAGVTIYEIGGSRFSPRQWLANQENVTLIEQLRLSAREQLLIARNGVSLLSEPQEIEADWSRLGDLLTLVSALPHDDVGRRPVAAAYGSRGTSGAATARSAFCCRSRCSVLPSPACRSLRR
jgi:hypothetical protein